MEIYLTITAMWNILTGLFSLITSSILLMKYHDRISGMAVILKFGWLLSFLTIAFYIFISIFHPSSDFSALFGRPLIGLLNSLPGLLSVSQILRIIKSSRSGGE